MSIAALNSYNFTWPGCHHPCKTIMEIKSIALDGWEFFSTYNKAKAMFLTVLVPVCSVGTNWNYYTIS